ncbi:unnamed protein product [Brassica oleracea]
MDSVVRVFRRESELPDNNDNVQNAGSAFSSVRLLVTSTQAIHLIGKHGSLIKSIMENFGASVPILLEGGSFKDCERSGCCTPKDICS